MNDAKFRMFRKYNALVHQIQQLKPYQTHSPDCTYLAINNLLSCLLQGAWAKKLGNMRWNRISQKMWLAGLCGYSASLWIHVCEKRRCGARWRYTVVQSNGVYDSPSRSPKICLLKISHHVIEWRLKTVRSTPRQKLGITARNPIPKV
jgi:hypothetical protein